MAEMMFGQGAPIPQEAIRYLEKKIPTQSFSYKDIWAEEHAQAFTVAKAMQMDVLTTIQESVNEAIRKGTSLKEFTKTLQPMLEQKGWWGKKDMVDPKTGEVKTAQLGSARRLKTIYQVNMRSAYNAGRYQQAMASELHPYLMFKVGPVRTKHRDQHLAWHGTVLPKDDEWWDSHVPPLGYGCNCTIEPVSRTGLKRLEQEGVGNPVQRDIDGGAKRMLKISTTRPKTTMKTFVNNRTGAVRKVPNGVTPGFEHNQGKYGRSVELANVFIEKNAKLHNDKKIVKEYLSHPVMRDNYSVFIRQTLSRKQGTGRAVPVVMLDDKLISVAERKGKKVASGMVVLTDNVVLEKQTKHKKDGGGHLSDNDFLRIPDFINQPERVYWDTKENNNNLLFTKQVEKGILFMPVQLNAQAVGIRVEKIPTLYVKNTSYEQMDADDRYEQIK